jgi:hypothetical protein
MAVTLPEAPVTSQFTANTRFSNLDIVVSDVPNVVLPNPVAVSSVADGSFPVAEPPYMINGFHADFPVIDIPVSRYGIFTSFRDSVSFIPEKFVRQIRSCYITIVQKLVNDKFNELLWKKLFLLPIVLLIDIKRSTLAANIKLVLADNWSKFTVGLYARAPPKNSSQFAPDDEIWSPNQKYAYKCIQNSRLSKAMQVLTTRNGVAPGNLDTYMKLLAKHPASTFENQDDDIPINDQNLEGVREVSEKAFRAAVKKGKKMVKPGIDKLRFEYLQTLVGVLSEPNPQERLFCSLFAEMLTYVIRGETPVNVKTMLRDNELIALEKGNADIRPIGMGETIRKVVSSVLYQRSRTFNDGHFKKWQYGLKRNGVEHIVHSVRFLMEEHPTWDLFCVDADNAFNRADRRKGLKQVQTHFPEALPFVKDMYQCISNGWYNGLPDGVSYIPSKNGYHQGDVLASWLYIMTTQPLLQIIDDTISAEFPNDTYYQGWYIDDGNILAPRPVMKRIVQILQLEGPQYGYNIKKNKGSYLLGRCNSIGDAIVAKADLENSLGLLSDIIHVNPENDTSLNSVSAYGAKLLGSPVGSVLFIRNFCTEHLKELKDVADDLLKFPDLQGRWLLFHNCFLSKPNFLFRTVPCIFLGEFIAGFEVLKKKVLASLLNCSADEIPNENYGLLNFSINSGGLGLHMTQEVSLCGFNASIQDFCLSSNDVGVRLADCLRSGIYDNPFADFAATALTKLKMGNSVAEAFESLLKLSYSYVKGSVQHQLEVAVVKDRKLELEHFLRTNQPQHLVWWENLQNPESGAWLKSIPKIPKFQMSNKDFSSALRYRCFFPISGINEGIRCNCANKPVVDKLGHHLATGCAIGGTRAKTHDGVVLELRDILRYCGLQTKVEERGLFRITNPNSNNRPDITVTDPPGSVFKTLAIDVGVTSPLTGYNNPESYRLYTGIAAKNMAADKKAKYARIGAQANELQFLPFILESTGFIHEDAIAYLHRLADIASDSRGIPSRVLYNYFVKRLSLRLQCGIANSINRRLEMVKSHNSAGMHDPSFASEVVLAL